MIPVRIREDLIDEDKKLKVLLAANFGRSKNNESKQRKVAVEYVKLCGYKQGGDRKSNCQNGALKLSEIASQLGTSERNLQRALSIERNLTDSMKELLETNIRQRGDVGGSAKKVGLRIKELERIYGIKNGGNRGNQYKEADSNNYNLPKQTDIAEKLGMSMQTLQNYKKITEMIPELEELVDTGIAT